MRALVIISKIGLSLTAFALGACVSQPSGPTWGGVDQPTAAGVIPPETQGRYVIPNHQRVAPVPRVPPVDTCRSQFYRGLIGQHEGSIYIAGLPGRKRILKPAFLEEFDRESVLGIDPNPPFIEVRDFLPDQVLYAPSIRTVSDLLQLGPAVQERLTIELDREGYVQQVRCG